MSVINDFINSLVNKDVTSLVELFDRDAHYDDFSPSGMFSTETHLIGREAIHMHFANRFIFGTYIVTAGKQHDETCAELDVFSVGKASKVSVRLAPPSKDGKIKSVVLMPV